MSCPPGVRRPRPFARSASLLAGVLAAAACTPPKDPSTPGTRPALAAPVAGAAAAPPDAESATSTPPPACSDPSASTEGPDDGRFTLGVDGQRLMYGYPIPYSTSHFVLTVDGHHATNNPGSFRNMSGQDVRPGSPPRATHVRGTLKRTGVNEGRTEITYRFGGVTLTQRLIPVDGKFVATTEPPSHYRIEYELQNHCGHAVSAGLLLQIDTMIDDNDACQMRAGSAADAEEQGFTGADVPDEILAYRDIRREDDLVGVFSLDAGEAVKPDALYIGPWPRFYHALWNVRVSEGASYGDSAVIFRWDKRDLEPGKTRRVATHYGLKKGTLTLLHSTNAQAESIDVYFDTNSAQMTAATRKQIDGFIEDKVKAAGAKKIVGVVVEGRADAVYEDDYNMRLSRRRADTLRDYLRRRTGDLGVKIITKAFGEAQADQSSEAQSHGRIEDRRGTIVLYRKP